MVTNSDRPTITRGDLFDPQCPTRLILDRIGDKWTVLVVEILADGPRRFTEIRTGVGGVTAKVLTNTLRNLERDGMVTRTVHAEVPPRVEYELTELGISLLTPLDALREWAESNLPQILDSRDQHDGRVLVGSSS